MAIQTKPRKGRIPPFIGTRNAAITRWCGNIGREPKRRAGDIFLHIRPEMQQKMKQPSAYPLGGHADGCVRYRNFPRFWGTSQRILRVGKKPELRRTAGCGRPLWLGRAPDPTARRAGRSWRRAVRWRHPWRCRFGRRLLSGSD